MTAERPFGRRPSPARSTRADARRLRVEPLEARMLLDGSPIITELMAINASTLADADGDFADWIEIHNPSDDAVGLDGWYLTDDAADPTKWQFPDVSLAAGEYLVVFASGKDRGISGEQLHANFKLNGGGEYLALIRPDGTTVAHEFAPEFPPQSEDISYGLVDTIATWAALVPQEAKLSYLVPTVEDAPLATEWTAADFDDSSWKGGTPSSPVLITEAGTRSPDYVEIQNVSDGPADTAGWVVAVNGEDADINTVGEAVWQLPDSIPAGEVLYQTDDTDENYWGGDITWKTTGNGWVMIVDGYGTVVDFVVWGYDPEEVGSLSVNVNGFDVTVDSVWSGDAVAANDHRSKTLQRTGNADLDNASNFTFAEPASRGEQNEGLNVPFSGGPATGIGFTVNSTDFANAIRTDVESEMHGAGASLWTRIPFAVRDPATLDRLLLRIAYNDGFVAYVNGREVARRNAPDSPAWDASATAPRSVAESLTYEEIDLRAHLDVLTEGRNVLAVHGLNVDAADDSFLIAPELVGASTQRVARHLAEPTPDGPATTGFAVINEIHYDPADKTERSEFIELYNPAINSVDLSGWRLESAVEYAFPDGTVLPGGGHLVVGEDPATLQSVFGVAALGPWTGRLENDGEEVVLRSASGLIEDEVDYRSRFPWPIDSRGGGASMELINPLLDNNLGGSWRPSGYYLGYADDTPHPPTPSQQNSVHSIDVPPQIRQVGHEPQQPAAGQPVTITAKVTDADGVAGVTVAYQLVDPGSYVRVQDPAYNDPASWATAAMFDDGTHGDAVAGDDVYTAVLPASLQTHRRLVRYRLTAGDTLGTSVTGPYADDPQPNFAYFVYDGVPAWTGADQPGVTAAVTFGTEVMNQLPVYHLIADGTDVTNSQYNGSYENRRLRGTMVYDGEVYDHIEFRIRGEFSTYQSGKNKWKFFFNRGHDFQARDPYGEKYATQWRTMNFSPASTPWMPVHRGMAGIGEAIAYKLFDLADVPSPEMFPLQFRVIDGAQEANPSNQYSGDLWGLYWTLEHPDGRFLDSEELPDGNVYKIESGRGDKKNQGPTDSPTNSDVSALMSGYNRSQNIDWWRTNLNLDDYYSFRSVGREVNNMDIREGWNVYYYHNPETGGWSPVPWDLDMLYSPVTHWSGVINMQNSIGQHPELEREYQARGRELQDLLFTADQIGQLVDEYAAFVNPPGRAWTMVDVDQFMWNYNSRSRGGHRGSYYTNPADAQPTGWSPAAVRTLVSADHEGMAQWLKDFMLPGRPDGNDPVGHAYGYDFLGRESADDDIPDTPTITYTGLPGYPLDDLTFRSGAFTDPQGDHTFGAMKWRVAEVTDPSAPAYDPELPPMFEVTTLWESQEITTFDDSIQVPGNVLQVGHAYRVRVRVQDSSGRWSHWSDPVRLIAGEPAGALLGGLWITEINYNPQGPSPEEIAGGFTDGDDFEFIELQNTGGEPIDLAGVKFTDGIDFDFTNAGVDALGPGEFLVVARNLAALTHRYGDQIPAVGGYLGRLDNDGERVQLEHVDHGTILAFEYNDANAWPRRADGNGSSLEVRDVGGDYNDGDNWRSSSEYGGSPGTAGEGPRDDVLINEVLSHSDAPLTDAIELVNTTGDPIDVGGWWLSDTNDDYRKFRIPASTTIPARGYVVFHEGHYVDGVMQFDADEFGGPDEGDFALNGGHGDDVWLLEADAAGKATRFVDHVEFGAAHSGESFGRWPDASGDLYPMLGPTLVPAGANSGPKMPSQVFISEVHYHPDAADEDALEFLEIYNPTGAAVDLTDWRLDDAVRFDFPAGTMLESKRALVVVPLDPQDSVKLAAFRAHYQIDASVQIVGGHGDALDNDGERVQLRDWDLPPAGEFDYTPHPLHDEVDYDDAWYPSTDGGGDSLHRVAGHLWGNAAASWTAAEPTPGTVELTATAEVVGRYVFYNHSTFDAAGDAAAVARDKEALLPGQTATFANYTSYVRGINGIAIDVTNLAGVPTAADFVFRVGNDDDPDGWAAAADSQSVTVGQGAGVGGSDRVTIIWPDNAVAGQWLQVTMSATPATGLARDDVFYFGNAIGEAGNSTVNAIVNTTDEVVARNFQHGPTNLAAIDDPYDYNRDRLVNTTDRTIARLHQTGPLDALRLIEPPAVDAVLAMDAEEDSGPQA